MSYKENILPIHLNRQMTSIDNFQLLKKLGKGAFGSVYKVKRLEDGQVYALKRIKLPSLNKKGNH